ncbi:integrase, catalytic region, zinc finger, CCHC-type containing protein [Tanacetum coccineum]
MMGNHSRLKNFVKKFIGTVRFGNDHFGAIMGYGDYVIDLKVTFRKHSCYVRDVDGVESLNGNRGSNLYTISVKDMMKSSPIWLLSKASKNKSWLWHHQLNHLNFGTMNDLARKDLVRGLPRLKFEKYHLCSACQLGKSKKYTHKPKSENTIMEVLHTLYMDLCGPIRVSLIHTRHNKTPYELVHGNKPDLTFLCVFGALCYLTNDNEVLGKLKAKADIGIFVSYAPNRKGYKIYNKRIRRIMEIIHVQFDDLTEHMAPVHISSGPDPILMTPGQISSGLPPGVERPVPTALAVQVLVVSAGTPYSTIIDQEFLPLESVETLREIVEEARIEKPLDNALEYAYLYTKRSQELLEYVIDTCPKEFRVNSSTEASGSKPRSNTKNNRILPAKSDNKKKIEDHPRNNKSNLKQENHVDYSISHKRTVWKATGKWFANVGYQWKPTGNKSTLEEQCPLTRITKSKVVPLQQPEHVSSSEIVITEIFTNTTKKPSTRYKRRNKKEKKISTGIPTTAETQTIDA